MASPWEFEYENDYDGIARRIGDILAGLLECSSLPNQTSGDNIAVTKDGLIVAAIELSHLHGWARSLADTHRQQQYAAKIAETE